MMMAAKRRQIESDLLGCKRELKALYLGSECEEGSPPLWSCSRATEVRSSGTLIVVSIPITQGQYSSEDDLYLRVSVFAPEIIRRKEDAKREVSRNFEKIKRVLGEMLPSDAQANRDVRDIRKLLFGDGMHASWDGINIEHVVPVSVGPAPSENRCLVIDYHIDGGPE